MAALSNNHHHSAAAAEKAPLLYLFGILLEIDFAFTL